MRRRSRGQGDDERPRRARVDAPDAAMRHGAAEDLRVQHVGQAQIVNIFRASRHLRAGFETGNAAADLSWHGELWGFVG